MLYKTYGRTGKTVSAISFGGMRFRNPEDIDGNAALVTYAHEQGINYFDTAPGYCADKSEDIVGAALRQLPRRSFYIATKCGQPQGDDVRASIERSLERLGVDTIDFFHIWCVRTPEGYEERKRGGAVDAALRAREEGLVQHVVVSTHMRGDEIADMVADGIFEGVTLGYNAINFPFRSRGVEACGDAGVGVVTMNPLGGGLIPRHADRFDFIRGEQDPDVVTAAMRFNVSNPAITSALVGFGSREEIDAAVEAVTGFEPYPPDHLTRLREHIEENFNDLCTGCGYCMPCEHGVEIAKLMDAYNHRMLNGNDRSVINRLKYHWGLEPADAEACVSCGACEELCTQGLPIVQRLQELSELAESSESS